MIFMSEKNILALMYDFYNDHTLRGQNDDIGYYIEQIKKYSAKKVLIIGAGTGRVAIPLSDYAEVIALDLDEARLNLLKGKNGNIVTICSNFLNVNLDDIFDLIILPYSTLQFDGDKNNLNMMLSKLTQIMSDETILIFDVSESFNTKNETEKKFLFKDFCSECKSFVEVYYSSKRNEKYIEFFIEYKLIDINFSVIENERYYYYNRDLLLDLVNKNDIDILKIDDGYGNNEFKHKHLYHCRRKN